MALQHIPSTSTANFQVEAFPEGMIYFMSAPGLRLSIDDCFQHTTLLHRERESSMLEAVVKCRFVCKYLPSRYWMQLDAFLQPTTSTYWICNLSFRWRYSFVGSFAIHNSSCKCNEMCKNVHKHTHTHKETLRQCGWITLVFVNRNLFMAHCVLPQIRLQSIYSSRSMGIQFVITLALAKRSA